jgi:hypothetical protein
MVRANKPNKPSQVILGDQYSLSISRCWFLPELRRSFFERIFPALRFLA